MQFSYRIRGLWGGIYSYKNSQMGYRRRFSVFFNNKVKWSINLKNVVLHLIVLIPLKYQSTKYIKIISNKYTLVNYAL